ncbi:MAG: DUF5615 family PIN-like protein [Candidatus Loosdrechtia sp.]|nr:MAG: DUF5615 family PIN-like protein [Candidatus Jettenia sp. AMX2]
MMDDDIWKFCQEEQRLLITTDKRFCTKETRESLRHLNHPVETAK